MKTLPQWVFANCSFPEYVHGVAIVFSVVYFWTIRSQVFWVFEVGSKIFSPEATKLKILFAAERKKTLLAKTLIVSNSQSSFFCRISYTVYDIPYLTKNNLELYSACTSSRYLHHGQGRVNSTRAVSQAYAMIVSPPNAFKRIKWIFMRRLRNFDNQMFTLLIGWFIWNSFAGRNHKN